MHTTRSLRLRHWACAGCLALLTAGVPARAAVIASFEYSLSLGWGSTYGDVQNFSPLFTTLVNGNPVLSAVPVNGDNVFELSGSALTTMAAELADGAPDAYGLTLFLDSVLDVFGLLLGLSESNFTGAAALPGADIQGIRISILDLCMQPTSRGGCASPGPGFVGFAATYRVEVSDAPFVEAPEPGTLGLAAIAMLGLAMARRRRDRYRIS